MAQKSIYHNLYYVFQNIFFKLKPIIDKIVVKDNNTKVYPYINSAKHMNII